MTGASSTSRYGEPAPWFRGTCDEVADVTFDGMAGRWICLMFFGSLAAEQTAAAYAEVLASSRLFDGESAVFVGVSVDPRDRTQGRLSPSHAMRHFDDYGRAISRHYGIQLSDSAYRPEVLLLDPLLRVVERGPIEATAAVLRALDMRLAAAAGEEAGHAPVLTVPRIFEPELCRVLIDHYDKVGGTPTGFMQQRGDKTVVAVDPSFKRRADVYLAEDQLKTAVLSRISHRLVPVIERAFGWRATRVERYMIACYSSEDQGFFRAHRDNTTLGTAHRRLAVTINLNRGDYEGGELCFPEFGSNLFSPPTGGATVFGCGLLHEVRPVTRGRRYAYLPFLYDEAGATLREQNAATLKPERRED